MLDHTWPVFGHMTAIAKKKAAIFELRIILPANETWRQQQDVQFLGEVRPCLVQDPIIRDCSVR
ncbi:hypothetical protein BJH93_08940 [Kocuria polaris]|nr:hypothetical protein [Kocuria polaris]